MSKVQLNGTVNDNMNTRVRFTVQRRPHRSNCDAREMLYDDDDTDMGVRQRRQIMQLLSHYTRTSTCQTSPSYSIRTSFTHRCVSSSVGSGQSCRKPGDGHVTRDAKKYLLVELNITQYMQ